MLGNNVIAMIAIVFMGCSKVARSFELLIIGRLIIGVNCGINTAVAPLYLTEIAPVQLRGVLGNCNQLGVVIALLAAEVLGLRNILGTADEWPLLLILCGVFALYQLLILPMCPETPAYLVSKGFNDEAKDSLKFLRGSQDDVDQELEDLKSDISHSRDDEKISIRDIFSTRSLRRPMRIAIMLQLSQQLSGITAALYYSTSIFVSAGVSRANSDLVTVGMGLANVVTVIISLFLIERLGRRVLMLVGLGGMCIFSVILVISLTVGGHAHWGSVTAVVAVILFVIAFQTGPGSIPWFITAELFSENARASAMSVAGVANWSANFVVGISYLPLQNVIDGYTFTIFAVLLAFFWIYTYLKVPETKGRRVEEISRLFGSE